MSTNDPVNNPSHYTNGLLPGECLDYTSHIDFVRGNIVKYLWRYGKKNGQEDLAKAEFYAKYLVLYPERLQGVVPQDKLRTLLDNGTKIATDPDTPEDTRSAVTAVCVLCAIDPENDPTSITLLSLETVEQAVQHLVAEDF